MQRLRAAYVLDQPVTHDLQLVLINAQENGQQSVVHCVLDVQTAVKLVRELNHAITHAKPEWLDG